MVLFDDALIYWNANSVTTKTLESTTKISGDNSVKFTWGDSAFAYIAHHYSDPQNFANYSNILFYWYGNNDGGKYRFILCSDPTSYANFFYYDFTDSFSGFQFFNLTLTDDFSVNGSPDIEAIYRVRFGTNNDNQNGVDSFLDLLFLSYVEDLTVYDVFGISFVFILIFFVVAVGIAVSMKR